MCIPVLDISLRSMVVDIKSQIIHACKRPVQAKGNDGISRSLEIVLHRTLIFEIGDRPVDVKLQIIHQLMHSADAERS
jgi:hypothetical protein